MNEVIRHDTRTATHPDAFRWNGAVETNLLRSWVDELGGRVPAELFDLWQWTGGGDMFDSETVFRPIAGPADPESVSAVNKGFRESGLSAQYLVFHQGVFLSAIRMADATVVELDPQTFEEVTTFASLDDWYSMLIRPAFAERYWLGQLDHVDS